MSQATITTDHQIIQQWTEEREGYPARVKGTESGSSELLRIAFREGNENADLEAIEWEEFFQVFDENRLALLYQERTDGDRISRFNKIVSAPEGILHDLHVEHESTKNLLRSMSENPNRDPRELSKQFESLQNLLKPHMRQEEETFYAVLKKECSSADLTTVIEGFEEHALVKKELGQLRKADPETPEWTARLNVLQELVEHHIEEEENKMFPLARDCLGRDRLEELGRQYGSAQPGTKTGPVRKASNKASTIANDTRGQGRTHG